MRERYLVYGSPMIQEDEIQEVLNTLRSGWIGTGPKVAVFEESFRRYKEAKYAVALNSCTAALHLSLVAAGVGKGDKVIVTPMTFAASINAILHAGAQPVLADIDEDSLNIDPSEIERKIDDKTKAIVVVHFAGRPCNMDAISFLAKKYHLTMIEDCAHAIEAEYQGKKIGTFGDFGCFSFYVTKNVITGEGGMVLSSDKEKADRIKRLGLHGMSQDAWKRFSDEGYKHYFVEELGFKYNMTDIQASLGIHQLERVEENLKRREAIWYTYQKAFKGLPISLPTNPAPNTKHALHLYSVRVNKARAGISRDGMLQALDKCNIGTGVHYLSIPEHPYYQRTFGWKPQDYPKAWRVGQETLSLPLSPGLSPKDVKDVIEAVEYVLTHT